MLTIAVCDDKIQFAQYLVDRLRELCATKLPVRIIYQVVSAFHSADDVLAYLESHPISILFLDIDMPGLNGFELAARLNKISQDIVILFVSDYDDFVYRSFEYNPFRFLRKAHLGKELPDAFQRAVEKCIIDEETLIFQTTYDEICLRVKDIYYLESARNYYTIHCPDNTYRCRGTLSQAERIVESYDFYRIHAGYLVNLENIDTLSGNHSIIMKNGQPLTVSQRKYNGFKDAYMNLSRRRYQ